MAPSALAPCILPLVLASLAASCGEHDANSEREPDAASVQSDAGENMRGLTPGASSDAQLGAGEHEAGALVADDTAVRADDDAGSGDAPGEGHARLVRLDYTTQTFALHDATGRLVHDLWPRLPPGDVSISWGDWTFHSDGSRASVRLRTQPAGLPPTGSTRFVVASRRGASATHVEIWTPDGSVVAVLDFDEHGDAFALSPGGNFLLAQRKNAASEWSDVATILRVSDGQQIWQGLIDSAAFSPDDRHFVFTPGEAGEQVGLLDLDRAVVRNVSNPTVYKYEASVQLSVEASSSNAAVLRTYGWISDGMPLWALHWDGRLLAFDPALPRLAVESTMTFRPGGASVVWRRDAASPVNGVAPIAPALLGLFEYDFATDERHSGVTFESGCEGDRARRFVASDHDLSVCDCASGACSVVAALPALAPGWGRQTIVSQDARFVVVADGWAGNAIPTVYPDQLLFDETGRQVATIPGGSNAQFDRLSEFLIYTGNYLLGWSGIGVFDLTTLSASKVLPSTPASGFIYE